MKATIARLRKFASHAPNAAPTTANNRLSISNWRTSRHREAPSARRTEISRSRTLALARRRFARLAQAINNTRPVVAIKTQSGFWYWRRTLETPVLPALTSSLLARYRFTISDL
jgi:hypothetical protein